jgi:hypothetical protein
VAITVATGGIAANATTAAPGLGGTASAGDLYIAHVAQDGAGTFTWTSPAVEIKDQALTGGVNTVAYLIAAGGETAMPLVTSTVTERWEWAVWRFPAGEWNGTTPPEINTGVTGSSTTPNPGSSTPSWGSETNNIWLALCARDDSVANTITAYPTNYSTAQADKNDITSALNVGGAVRIATGSPEDPGAFTISASETWIAYTVAIRPAAAGGGTTQAISAALSATATIAAAAVRTRRGSAALSANATIAPTARANRAAAAALSATATMSPTAGLLLSAAASLSASASLAAVAQIVKSISASLSASATLSASASRVVAIAAALSANASLQAAGVRILSGSAALSAVASLSATATLGAAVVAGDAVLVFTDSMVAVLTNAQAIEAGIAFPDSHEATLVV